MIFPSKWYCIHAFGKRKTNFGVWVQDSPRNRTTVYPSTLSLFFFFFHFRLSTLGGFVWLFVGEFVTSIFMMLFESTIRKFFLFSKLRVSLRFVREFHSYESTYSSFQSGNRVYMSRNTAFWSIVYAEIVIMRLKFEREME